MNFITEFSECMAAVWDNARKHIKLLIRNDMINTFETLVSRLEIVYFPKHPSCKSVWSLRMLLWKKMWNTKWLQRNGCGGRLMANNFNNNILGEFVLPSQLFTRIQHQIHLNCCYQNFAISLQSQPFLSCHFGFHIFSQHHSRRPHNFLQLGCFGLDFISLNVIECYAPLYWMTSI